MDKIMGGAPSSDTSAEVAHDPRRHDRWIGSGRLYSIERTPDGRSLLTLEVDTTGGITFEHLANRWPVTVFVRRPAGQVSPKDGAPQTKSPQHGGER